MYKLVGYTAVWVYSGFVLQKLNLVSGLNRAYSIKLWKTAFTCCIRRYWHGEETTTPVQHSNFDLLAFSTTSTTEFLLRNPCHHNWGWLRACQVATESLRSNERSDSVETFPQGQRMVACLPCGAPTLLFPSFFPSNLFRSTCTATTIWSHISSQISFTSRAWREAYAL